MAAGKERAPQRSEERSSKRDRAHGLMGAAAEGGAR